MGAKAQMAPLPSHKVVRIPISNHFMDGDYTGVVHVGSDGRPANVLLDTGSSTLALNGHFYDPSADPNARITRIAQAVQYGSGSWIGAVVLTNVSVGVGPHSTSLKRVNTAVAYRESLNFFGKADGILGLAYKGLNKAFEMPAVTWPRQHSHSHVRREGKTTHLDPYFAQLAEAGLVANRFAFYTRRSLVSHATSRPASDALNQGFLVLGGGEESTDLYSGNFQSIDVLHEEWYNTNLKAVIVGDSDPIEVHPLKKGGTQLTNSIVDSGTNALELDDALFQTVSERMAAGKNKARTEQIRKGHVRMNELRLADWPGLTFVMQSGTGEARLVVPPENYWQTDSPEKGHATAVLLSDHGRNYGQSVLGLPLMNGYFTIFDRSHEKGPGVIKFAPRK